jgi:hypothetical protein
MYPVSFVRYEWIPSLPACFLGNVAGSLLLFFLRLVIESRWGVVTAAGLPAAVVPLWRQRGLLRQKA